MKTIAAVLAAFGILFAGHATAHADNTDEAFLVVLDMYKVPHPNDTAAIAEAHKVCKILDQTNNLAAGGMDVMTTFPDLSLTKSGNFMGDAVGAYCPNHMDLYHDDQGAQS